MPSHTSKNQPRLFSQHPPDHFLDALRDDVRDAAARVLLSGVPTGPDANEPIVTVTQNGGATVHSTYPSRLEVFLRERAAAAFARCPLPTFPELLNERSVEPLDGDALLRTRFVGDGTWFSVRPSAPPGGDWPPGWVEGDELCVLLETNAGHERWTELVNRWLARLQWIHQHAKAALLDVARSTVEARLRAEREEPKRAERQGWLNRTFGVGA